MSLQGFSQQNVIADLAVETTESGLKLVLYPCFGFSWKSLRQGTPAAITSSGERQLVTIVLDYVPLRFQV